MNIADSVLIILCLLCTYCGYRIGVLLSIFFLIAGFLGSFLASNYYTIAEPFFKSFPQSDIWGYVCVFVSVFIALTLIGYGIRQLARILVFGLVDRIIGLIIGCMVGILISAGIGIPLAEILHKKNSTVIKKSYMVQPLITYTKRYINALPPHKRKIFWRSLLEPIKDIEEEVQEIPQRLKTLKNPYKE